MRKTYTIYVEGALFDSGLTKREAFKLRREFESEGWNIVILEMRQTILGEMGYPV